MPHTSTTGVYRSPVFGLYTACGHSFAPAGPGQMSTPSGVGVRRGVTRPLVTSIYITPGHARILRHPHETAVGAVEDEEMPVLVEVREQPPPP